MRQGPLSKMPGGLIVFLGALCWSLNSPIIQFLTLDSLLICALRSLIAFAALAGFLRPRRLSWGPWTLVYCISYAALCLCVVVALGLTSAPVAVGMQYTATIWLFLLNCLLTRHFDRQGALPVLVIFAGVLCFMSSGAGSAETRGNLVALSEGIFFALMTVSSKKAAGENPVGLTALANLFTAGILFLLFPRTLGMLGQMSGLEWEIMLVLGVVQVGAGYALYNLGVQRVSPQKASVLALWEMILGPLWVALFLHNYPAPRVVAGLGLVLLGMLLDARQKNSGTAPQES